MTTTDSPRSRTADASDQIAELRAQVEALISERLGPKLAEAAGQAEVMARAAGDAARDQADQLAGRVRQRPLLAVTIAAVAGFLIGRLFR
jgi:ElaB/YqjD/DUF883 family membrane-anchored ribosome-binding protein